MIDTPSYSPPTPEITSSRHALIDANVDGPGAKEFVDSLLNSALSCHRLRNLRSEVRTQSPDRAAWDSVRQLTAARSEIAELLRKAREEGREVRLEATLNIEVR